ncbi:DUF4124 domain-containing protein [Halomonas denitrificans]|nr:DUF4124 domain-containing protein [Halomonas denitrificans]
MQSIEAIFGLVMLLAGATIYQWVDEDGNRHYSDRKPDVEQFVEVELDEGSISTYRAVPTPAPAENGEGPENAGAAGPETPERAARSNAAARRDELERYCNDLLEDLDAVQDQLRRGYREPRGQQLRDRRRELRAAYRRECV